jgi:hypothetical protein
MALYSVRPITSPSVTATNGSSTILVTGNVNCQFIAAGTIVSVAGLQPVEAIKGTAADTFGNSTITLRSPWPNVSVVGPLIAFMAYEGLADAVVRLNLIIDQATTNAENAFTYKSDWDLATAGVLPAPPSEGSVLYRISTAATVGGVAYRAGDFILWDNLISVWRRLNDNLGSGAYASVVASVGDLTAGRLLTVGATKAQLADDVYGRSNILGTVSQSAGVPTGAIIQRGSNANGQFTRFADGTQDCWVEPRLFTAIGGSTPLPNYSNVEVISFPIAFTDTASVTSQYIGRSDYEIGNLKVNSPTAIAFRVTIELPNSVNAPRFTYQAKGRWFNI